jgi:acyl carrier protein
MANENILKELQPIFCDVFDDDDLVPSEEMTAADVDTWDSLSHIRLIVAVEERFGIKFTSAEVSAFGNVGEFASSIAAKVAARPAR